MSLYNKENKYGPAPERAIGMSFRSKKGAVRRHALLLALILALSAVLCGCGSLSADEKNNNAPQAGAFSGNYSISQITIGTLAKIEKAVRDEYNYDTLSSGVSELCLVSKNADGSFSPLAVSYKSEDSVTWTYRVTDGLCWSDGEKVTAEDILFSLEYEAKEKLLTEGDEKGTYRSCSISDDNKELTLVLEKANIKLLDDMAVLRIRPKHIYEGRLSDDISEDEKRISCGPYVLESFDKSAGTLVFTANENYPQKPNAKKIIYRLFSNEDVMYQALIQGDIDLVWNYASGVPVNYQSILAGSENIELESYTASNCPAVLVFNNSSGFFSDRNMREAAANILDYESFKTYFASPYAKTPERSFVPESLSGYIETEVLSCNPGRAAEFMKAAGYEKNGSFYEKDGSTAEFTLTVNSSKENQLGCSEFIKTQFENFGIKVNIDALDKTHYNERTSHKFAGDGEHSYGKITMEAAIMGYTAYGMSNLGGMYIDGNDKTQGGAEVYDKELSAAIEQLSSAANYEDYSRAAEKLQEFYAENIPVIALYTDSLCFARSTELKGLAIDANFGFNNVNSWFSAFK